MAWTAPRTWVPGELVDAAGMNEQVRDNFNYLDGLSMGAYTVQHRVSLYRTSAVSIANATYTSIIWQAQELDPNGMWGSGANITVQSGGAGVWIGGFNTTWSGHASMLPIATVAINGVYLPTMTRNASNYDTAWRRHCFFGARVLAVSDIITCVVRQQAGAAYNLNGTATSHGETTACWFMKVSD